MCAWPFDQMPCLHVCMHAGYTYIQLSSKCRSTCSVCRLGFGLAGFLGLADSRRGLCCLSSDFSRQRGTWNGSLLSWHSCSRSAWVGLWDLGSFWLKMFLHVHQAVRCLMSELGSLGPEDGSLSGLSISGAGQTKLSPQLASCELPQVRPFCVHSRHRRTTWQCNIRMKASATKQRRGSLNDLWCRQRAEQHCIGTCVQMARDGAHGSATAWAYHM